MKVTILNISAGVLLIVLILLSTLILKVDDEQEDEKRTYIIAGEELSDLNDEIKIKPSTSVDIQEVLGAEEERPQTEQIGERTEPVGEQIETYVYVTDDNNEDVQGGDQ